MASVVDPDVEDPKTKDHRAHTKTEYRYPSNPHYDYWRKVEGVRGHLSRQYPSIANPAPLGLCAFALTTFVLSMINAGAIVDLRAPKGIVLGLALFYGGLVQLLAGMWEFKTGNTFGATVFSSYGGFWMSYAALFINAFGFLDGYANAPISDLNNDVGIYLLAWCIFSFLMLICCHRATIVLFALFLTVSLTFLILAIGKFSGDDIVLQRIGGIFGIVAAALAWYGAIAKLLSKKTSLFRLPLGELDPIYIKIGWLQHHQLHDH